MSCQHQLDAPECLLTGLPVTVNQASPAKAAAKAASPASGWALRALKQNSSKQTQMLEALLKQHLQKQLLLTGNPVVVPVLGHQCVFRSPTLHCNIFCSARNATWMLSVWIAYTNVHAWRSNCMHSKVCMYVQQYDCHKSQHRAMLAASYHSSTAAHFSLVGTSPGASQSGLSHLGPPLAVKPSSLTRS